MRQHHRNPEQAAMSSGGGRRTISQEAFEEMVRENMEDLGMEPAEALEDAIHALSLQDVDLSGIVKCIPGVASAKDDPVLQALDALKNVVAGPPRQWSVGELVQLLEHLRDLCSSGGGGGVPEIASVAVRNGAVELLCSVCSSLETGEERVLASALKALSSVLRDTRSTEIFQNSAGPKIIMHILEKSSQSINLLGCGFSVVAAAATGNEIVKESFMDLKIDELFAQILNGQPNVCTESMYDAIRVLLTPDDDRVLASQVYGYARRLAQVGVADALVAALKNRLHSPSIISVCIALKAVAVNDEICRSISENGGIEATLQCIDESDEQNNKAIARSCCSLLSKLAGSDINKSAIVQKGGLDKLIKLSLRFSDDPYVLQEIMAVICTLSLRSPENAARAVEEGAGDLALQAMRKFPPAYQMQRQSCLMIRNLVVRNPQNRTILLSNGVEKLIRKAKAGHESCKDAARDALRDLGLDDYN